MQLTLPEVTVDESEDGFEDHDVEVVHDEIPDQDMEDEIPDVDGEVGEVEDMDLDALLCPPTNVRKAWE